MTATAELVREAEAIGMRLTLDGGDVRVTGPAGLPRKAAEPLMTHLRERRDEVAKLLRLRASAPPIPAGVRLIRWALLPPPIGLDVCSIVTEPERFAAAEIGILAAKLQNPRRWTGWTVVQHIERLRQVGVIVEVDS